MICVVELELNISDGNFTIHEHIQHRINATRQAYKEMIEECHALGISCCVRSISECFGHVLVDVPANHLPLLSSISCVQNIRESKLHQ